MAIEFRGGIILNRRPPLHPHRRRQSRHLLLRHHRPLAAAFGLPIRRVGPRESTQQALPRAAVRLVLPAPPGGRLAVGPQNGAVAQERADGDAGEEMPPLRVGEDPAVENGPNGPEDALQRVRGPVQVGPAGSRVPARRQPDFHLGEALEFAPESAGAPAAEGCAEAADN